MKYKLYKNMFGQNGIIKYDENSSTSFIFDEHNPDYQAYLAWLEEGNEPEAAD